MNISLGFLLAEKNLSFTEEVRRRTEQAILGNFCTWGGSGITCEHSFVTVFVSTCIHLIRHSHIWWGLTICFDSEVKTACLAHLVFFPRHPIMVYLIPGFLAEIESSVYSFSFLVIEIYHWNCGQLIHRLHFLASLAAMFRCSDIRGWHLQLLGHSLKRKAYTIPLFPSSVDWNVARMTGDGSALLDDKMEATWWQWRRHKI